MRALTDKPFGVNLILATLQAEWMGICLEGQVPLLVFCWGDPRPYIQEAHRRGITKFLQVRLVGEARGDGGDHTATTGVAARPGR